MDAEKILEVFDGEILMFFCLETKEPKVQDWIFLLKILKTF